MFGMMTPAEFFLGKPKAAPAGPVTTNTNSNNVTNITNNYAAECKHGKLSEASAGAMNKASNDSSKDLKDTIRQANGDINKVEDGLSKTAAKKLDALDDKFQIASRKAIENPSKENIAAAQEAGKALKKELGDLRYEADIKGNKGAEHQSAIDKASNSVDDALKQLDKMADDNDSKTDIKKDARTSSASINDLEDTLPKKEAKELDKLDDQFQKDLKKAIENPTEKNIAKAQESGEAVGNMLNDLGYECDVNNAKNADEINKASKDHDKVMDQLNNMKERTESETRYDDYGDDSDDSDDHDYGRSRETSFDFKFDKGGASGGFSSKVEYDDYMNRANQAKDMV